MPEKKKKTASSEIPPEKKDEQPPKPPEEKKPEEKKPEDGEPPEENPKKKSNGTNNLLKYHADIKAGLRKRVMPFEKKRALEAKKEANEKKVRKTIDNTVTDERILSRDNHEEPAAPRQRERIELNPMYLYIALGAIGIVGVVYAVLQATKTAKAPVVVIQDQPKPVAEPDYYEMDIGGGRIMRVKK